MFFERALSQQEIDDIREKGRIKARDILATANQSKNPDEYLRNQFTVTIGCIGHLIENFYPDSYIERGNYKKPDTKIKPMLLSAFKAVQCLTEFESLNIPNLSPFKGKQISEWYETRLIVAEKTYRTNAGIIEPSHHVPIAA